MSVMGMAIVLVFGAILVLAICLRKEVKFSVRLPGAGALLEVRAPARRTRSIADEERATARAIRTARRRSWRRRRRS